MTFLVTASFHTQTTDEILVSLKTQLLTAPYVSTTQDTLAKASSDLGGRIRAMFNPAECPPPVGTKITSELQHIGFASYQVSQIHISSAWNFCTKSFTF